jgi:hypothetical protein
VGERHVRTYVVRPGDSPAKIASRDDMAGCPKCGGIDFVRANPHKEFVVHPNGFTTFKEIRVGERLNLPEKWFDGTMDRLPKSYFESLPYADGVTPGKGVGVGAPPSEALVSAARAVDAALQADNDAGIDYCVTVARPGTAANSTVHAFKLLWNATQSPPVPINTGNYEPQVAKALQFAMNEWESWDPCPVRTSSPSLQPKPLPTPAPVVQSAKKSLSTGEIFGLGLVGASAVGGAIYLATRRPRRRRRR